MENSKHYWVHRFVDNDSMYYNQYTHIERCVLCDYDVDTNCHNCARHICHETAKRVITSKSKRTWTMYLMLIQRPPFKGLPLDVLWCIYQFIQPSFDIATACQPVKLQCGHVFHLHCMQDNKVCPKCRMGVSMDGHFIWYSTLLAPIVYTPHMRAINHYSSFQPFVLTITKDHCKEAMEIVKDILRCSPNGLKCDALYARYKKRCLRGDRIPLNVFVSAVHYERDTGTFLHDKKSNIYSLNPKRQKKT